MLDVIGALWRYRLMIALIATPVVILCALYAFLATPVYRAEVLMAQAQIDTDTGDLGSLARDIGQLAGFAGLAAGSDLDQKHEAMALMQSRGFLVDFIDGRKLMPILFPEPDPEDPPTGWDAYRMFSEHILDVKEDSDTGLVTVGIEWRDRVMAANWANDLVRRLNAQMRARTVEESQKTIRYLTAELDRTPVIGVQQGIYQLIESYVNRIAVTHSREDYAFKVIDAAYPAEVDEYVRPRRLLLIAFGIVIGFALGAMVALLRMTIARTRAERGMV
jgi:uncharacterized protein involved in exopolysaccharide biosynthesis